MVGRWAGVAGLVLLAGCGDGGASPMDAGAGRDAQADAGFLPSVPAPPVPPLLLPCPAGWRELPSAVVGTGPSTCDPWPEGGFVDCAAPDEAMFPGGGGCVRLGPACPGGDFADDLPTDRPIVYALAGAPAGGDGSRARPFATITLAARAAASMPGSVVAAGKGEYDELVSVPAEVTVWGACVAETVVRYSGASAPLGLVSFLGRGGGVRNLRIAAAPGAGIWVDGARREATVENVIVTGTSSTGIAASRGAHLVVRGVVVHDLSSHGFEIVEGASAELSRVLVERARDTGFLSVTLGTTAHLEDVAVRETRPFPDGRGLSVQEGSVVDATRLVIEHATESAVFVQGPGASATLSDVVVREVGTARGGLYGRAIAVQGGASCEVSRAWLEALGDLALASFDPGSMLRVEDAVVRDVRGDDLGGFGRGLAVQVGGAIEATRVLIEHLRDVGLFVADVGSTASCTDVTIRDVQPAGDVPVSGRGASIQEGARATLARVVIEQASEAGIMVVGTQSAAQADDVAIRGTRGTEAGEWGDGLMVVEGATLTAARLSVEDSRRFGVLAGTAASLDVTALAVRRTLAQSCVPDGCPGAPGFGVGIAATEGARATVADFVVDGADLCGVFVEGTSSLDLARGEVHGAPVGACVQAVGYDYGRISSSVAYYDVGRTLDTTRLPVPALGSPLSSF